MSDAMADRAAAMARLAEGWVPTHSPEAQAHLDEFLRDAAERPIDPHRFVAEPSGLSHRDIHSLINDRSIGERFFEIHADFLHPEDSRYVDPVFGELRGQRAIREWLVPTMSGVGAVSFDATFPAAFLDDGEGGTSIDEWRLTTLVDDEWVPVTEGISIRRYRGGWITDAIDYFDTLPIRMGAMQTGMELPAPPAVGTTTDPAWATAGGLSSDAEEWLSARRAAIAAGSWPDLVVEPSGLANEDLFRILFNESGADHSLICDLLHPERSVYVAPLFGHLTGQAPIRAWLLDVMGKTGTIEFEPTSPPILDGDVAFREFRQLAVLPSGETVEMARGASVRRFADGWLVPAADYFDVATFLDPGVQAASAAAGSTITEDDVRRYRDVSAVAG